MATVDGMRVYPPLVKTAQPAFDLTNQDISANWPTRIYFSIGAFNSGTGAIQRVHVTIAKQTTNQTILASKRESGEDSSMPVYPYGIKVCIMHEDKSITNDYKYYIEIDKNDLAPRWINGAYRRLWEDSVNYKVQLRFDTVTPAPAQYNAAYFSNNLSEFSEWSTVTLLRGIYAPTLEFNPEIPQDDASGQIPTRNVGDTLVATYVPGPSSSPRYVESLKCYRVQVLNYTTKQVLSYGGIAADTEVVYVPSYDYTQGYCINYTFPIVLQTQESYTIRIWFETKNGYQREQDHSFVNTTASADNFNNDDPSGSCEMNYNDGYMMIHFGTGKTMTTNVTMRRTSSKTNFIIWEDVANLTVEREVINWTFNDFTVESGVTYQYGFQKRDIYGRRGTLWRIPQQILCEFEDVFLTEKSLVETYEGSELVSREGKQLKIKYDPVVSSFKYQTAESRTETLGSRYPYIRRNATLYYRTFPISGLVTRYMDDSNKQLFIEDVDLFGGQTSVNVSRARRQNRLNSIYDRDPSVYQHREGERWENGELVSQTEPIYYDYNEQYDYYHERIFREAVQDFLYNANPKIYRSETEGNILIKLMDVNFTPVQELGRLLYRFTATAYEIDEPSLENFEKYGIQYIGSYQTDIAFNQTKIAQISSFDKELIKANTNIKDMIDKYEFVGEARNGAIITGSNLNYIRLEMEDDPHLINISDPNNPVVTDIPPFGSEGITDKNTMVGWVIRIDSVPIIIAYPNRIYEAKGANVYFSQQIVPLQDTQMSIDYVVSLAQVMDNTNAKATVEPAEAFGQLFRTFEPQDEIVNYIYKHYRKSYNNIRKSCKGVHTLNVEAYPYSLLYVTTIAAGSDEQKRQRLVINHTGNLFVDPGNALVITSAYFRGRTFHKDELNFPGVKRAYPEELDCVVDKGITKIYYHGAWHRVYNIVDGVWYDIDIEIDAIIDYTCAVETGTVASRSS